MRPAASPSRSTRIRRWCAAVKSSTSSQASSCPGWHVHHAHSAWPWDTTPADRVSRWPSIRLQEPSRGARGYRPFRGRVASGSKEWPVPWRTFASLSGRTLARSAGVAVPLNPATGAIRRGQSIQNVTHKGILFGVACPSTTRVPGCRLGGQPTVGGRTDQPENGRAAKGPERSIHIGAGGNVDGRELSVTCPRAWPWATTPVTPPLGKLCRSIPQPPRLSPAKASRHWREPVPSTQRCALRRPDVWPQGQVLNPPGR